MGVGPSTQGGRGRCRPLPWGQEGQFTPKLPALYLKIPLVWDTGLPTCLVLKCPVTTMLVLTSFFDKKLASLSDTGNVGVPSGGCWVGWCGCGSGLKVGGLAWLAGWGRREAVAPSNPKCFLWGTGPGQGAHRKEMPEGGEGTEGSRLSAKGTSLGGGQVPKEGRGCPVWGGVRVWGTVLIFLGSPAAATCPALS